MQKDNLHYPIAITYAHAILELAGETADMPGGAEIIGQELASLRQMMVEEPLVRALLMDPALSQEDRYQLLERVFAGRVSPLLLKFLHLLGAKGRLNMLSSIAGAYQILLDQQLGKVEVDVTVPQRLDAA